MDPTREPGIKIAQIFLEHVAFKHRADYLLVPPQPNPDPVGDVNVQVETGLSPDRKQGLVRLRVQTRPENTPLYEFDVAIAALVIVDSAAPNMPLEQYFAISGGALLYPFMRQTIADLTGRGRFGPVWLNPINLTAVPSTSSAEPLPKIKKSRLGPARQRRPAKRVKAKTRR